MKALLLIDIQNDYFKKGKCELVDSLQAALNSKILLDKFRQKNLPIIYIQHISTKKDATFFLPNSFGVQIHESLKPLDNELVITKNFPNSFRNTTLKENLEKLNVQELVICGMMTHMCVDSTIRAAFDMGYKCSVAYDGCATKDLKINNKIIKAKEVHNSFMASFEYIFAKVLKVEEIICSI